MSQATRAAKRQEIEEARKGEGVYLLMNISGATLNLSKPSIDGRPVKTVEPNQVFMGDSYHINTMPGLVQVVKVIVDPAKPVPEQTNFSHIDQNGVIRPGAPGAVNQQSPQNYQPVSLTPIETNTPGPVKGHIDPVTGRLTAGPPPAAAPASQQNEDIVDAEFIEEKEEELAGTVTPPHEQHPNPSTGDQHEGSGDAFD